MGIRILLYRFASTLMMQIKPRWVKTGEGCYLYSCKFKNNGAGNKVNIDEECSLSRCVFQFTGTNNVIKIGPKCVFSGVSFWISGNNNVIEIGDKTTVGRNTQFAALEGTVIRIGKDCMFSHDIKVRTSDSHSIINSDGVRINHARDITIGNHCWIGMQCLLLKGSALADNSILAARATLNKKFEVPGCIIGGFPAKILKTGVNWDRKKL